MTTKALTEQSQQVSHMDYCISKTSSPTKVSHKLDSPSKVSNKNYFTSRPPKCLHFKLDSIMATAYIDFTGRTVPKDILLERFQNGWDGGPHRHRVYRVLGFFSMQSSELGDKHCGTLGRYVQVHKIFQGFGLLLRTIDTTGLIHCKRVVIERFLAKRVVTEKRPCKEGFN
jgi:hypothetical protein